MHFEIEYCIKRRFFTNRPEIKLKRMADFHTYVYIHNVFVRVCVSVQYIYDVYPRIQIHYNHFALKRN